MGLARILGFTARSRARVTSGGPRSVRKLVSICRTLLSERGSVTGAHLASVALEMYQSLDQPGRKAFLDILNRDFSPTPTRLASPPTPIETIRLQTISFTCSAL